MSSIWSLKRRGSFMLCLAILTKMLIWGRHYQEDERRCAYKIKRADLAIARALLWQYATCSRVSLSLNAVLELRKIWRENREVLRKW